MLSLHNQCPFSSGKMSDKWPNKRAFRLAEAKILIFLAFFSCLSQRNTLPVTQCLPKPVLARLGSRSTNRSPLSPTGNWSSRRRVSICYFYLQRRCDLPNRIFQRNSNSPSPFPRTCLAGNTSSVSNRYVQLSISSFIADFAHAVWSDCTPCRFILRRRSVLHWLCSGQCRQRGQWKPRPTRFHPRCLHRCKYPDHNIHGLADHAYLRFLKNSTSPVSSSTSTTCPRTSLNIRLVSIHGTTISWQMSSLLKCAAGPAVWQG